MDASPPAGISRIRMMYLVFLVCAGCAPVAEPDKPVPGPNSSTSSTSTPRPANEPDNEPDDERATVRPQYLTELFSLIRERLELMPRVAQAKWNRKLPITDTQREATLLDRLQAKAIEHHLPPDLVREFFRAQITAAKLIQEQLFADWTASRQMAFENPPDLEREIRPRIDTLNEQLLTALANYLTERSRDGDQDAWDTAAHEIFPPTEWREEIVRTALAPLKVTNNPAP